MHPSRVLIALLIALAPTLLRADAIVLAGADGRSSGQQINDVTIRRIDGDALIYQQSNGVETSRPLSRVLTINVPADPNFTAGEAAFATGKPADAIDPYVRALRTNDAWKIRRAAPRVIEAAAASKRFDAAVGAYIAYAHVDPAAAVASKPTLPARGSAFLDDARHSLDAAVHAATADPERQALLALELDVQLARGDQDAAQSVADQLARIGGANGNAAADPALAALTANVRLSQARLAIQAKRYADAIAAVDAAAPQLAEPRQRAEALFLRAEAQAGLIPADDRDAPLDAAAAYLKVVAVVAANEGQPFFGDALSRAAHLSADAGDLDDARKLCAQIAAELPNTDAARDAAALLARLGPATSTPS